VQVLGVDVEVGEPWVLGPLTVFPLTSGKATAKAVYVPGPEAFEKGLVNVSELDPPQVPFLVVENLAAIDLLLVEGETLVGGNQNRTLNTTVLLPPSSRTVVPVSCVEAGRWGRASGVARSRSHLPAKIRAAKTANLSVEDGPGRWRSDQGRVWQEVAEQAERHVVWSDTSALEDVTEAVREQLDEVLENVTPAAEQIGIVCAAGATVLGVDIFDRPETFVSYLKSLVAGYRLDADENAGRANIAQVERFLLQVDRSEAVPGPGIGLGEELRLHGNVTGLGLRLDADLIHLGAFLEPEPVA
jgi:hypothetical protein